MKLFNKIKNSLDNRRYREHWVDELIIIILEIFIVIILIFTIYNTIIVNKLASTISILSEEIYYINEGVENLNKLIF